MNQTIQKRRNPFEKPKQNVEIETEKEVSVEDVSISEEENLATTFDDFKSEEVVTNEPVYQPQKQPIYQSQPQYYENRQPQRTKNVQPKVVNRDTRQYYAANIQESRDKFTSTMETTLRRNIKIVCAQRGIMFAQFVEDACREKLEREGFR